MGVFIPKGSTLGLARRRELWYGLGSLPLGPHSTPPCGRRTPQGWGAGEACGESSETKTLFFFFLPYWEHPCCHLLLLPECISMQGLQWGGGGCVHRAGSHLVGKHEHLGKTSTLPRLMWFSGRSQMMVCVCVCQCVQYVYCVCK